MIRQHLCCYAFDAPRGRLARKVDGQITQGFIWMDDTFLLAETDSSGNITTTYLYGESYFPEALVRNGITYKIVSDQIGTPRLVINANDGSVVKQLVWDEFGNLLSDSNPSFLLSIGFAGGLRDADTGLTHFGARELDNFSGRFISKEPIGFEGGTNFYNYSLGDPINLVDTNGLWPDDPAFIPGPAGSPKNDPNFNRGLKEGFAAGAVIGAVILGAPVAPKIINNRYIRIGEGKFPEPFSKRISIGSQKGNKIEFGMSKSGRIDFKIGGSRYRLRGALPPFGGDDDGKQVCP